MCAAYLDFAADRPKVYRLMFGGVWNAEQAIAGGSVAADDVTSLGRDALELLATCLDDCVAGRPVRQHRPRSDSIALWLGLHGLASQRAASPAFPWPADIQQRLVTALAHLEAAPKRR